MKEFNKTQILLVILILLVVGYIIFPKRPIVQGISIEQMVDSLEVHDSYRGKEVLALKVRYSQDSMRINILQNRLPQIPKQKEAIEKKYNDKRNRIDTASTDEQGRFFADWTLSEEDN